MRSFFLLLLLLASTLAARAQPKTPADFGYRHLTMRYQGDTVHILVLSKKGEELKRKPVFLLVQGSLPSPVFMYYDKGNLSVFPFETQKYLTDYHLVIIGKPGVPLVADIKTLTPRYEYHDPRTGVPPVAYCQHNYLEYYVARDTSVLHYLARQPWVDATAITAMGHSEGTFIVARMARKPGALKRVIYLSGSPLGRILTIVAGIRAAGDSAIAENELRHWSQTVASPHSYDCTNPGDSNLTTASFSEVQSPLQDFLHTKIPVFVGYGTRDDAALTNDYLRLELARAGKTNFTFRAYEGLEHNFMGFTDGKVDENKWNWDRVAHDFFTWMKTH